MTSDTAELAPLEVVAIDPRPCGLCGLAIDRHVMLDHGDGPEHFCPDLSPDEMTLDELERRHELRIEEEAAAIMARWEAMDEEIARRTPTPSKPTPPCYRPPQATQDTFWYVVGLKDPGKLSEWLRDHPRDTPFLLTLLEAK